MQCASKASTSYGGTLMVLYPIILIPVVHSYCSVLVNECSKSTRSCGTLWILLELPVTDDAMRVRMNVIAKNNAGPVSCLLIISPYS
jgi:hypothetical protein